MAIRLQTKRALLLGFIGSIAVCGLLGIICLLKGSMGRFEERILGSTALVGAASILGLASAIPWERRRWHPIGQVGVIVAASALVLSIVGIWAKFLGVWIADWERREFLWKIDGAAWVFAVAIPLVGLLSLARLHRRYGWVRRWTIVAIACLASLLAYLIMAEPYGAMDTLMRVVGVLAIFAVCGVLAVPVFHRVSAIKTREAVRTVELRVSLTCPRCAETQELSVGRSKCFKCGLRFSIEIEEDLCATCGYPLYKLESAACPECGTPIAQIVASE